MPANKSGNCHPCQPDDIISSCTHTYAQGWYEQLARARQKIRKGDSRQERIASQHQPTGRRRAPRSPDTAAEDPPADTQGENNGREEEDE
jgi:hypothetical protein